MRLLRFPSLFFAIASLCVALPSRAQGVAVATPLNLVAADQYQKQKASMGVVLLSVNWSQRSKCSGFEDAALQSIVFDQVPTARRDEERGDLVIDVPQAGTADYAFLVPPGAYALSGFDITVVKSGRDRGGYVARRSRLLKDGFASDGGFDVRAGEIVYVGEFSVECRTQPVPWRSYPEGPGEFQEYLGRIKPLFPALETRKAQFRPMSTRQFGAQYVPATVLKDAPTRSIPDLMQRATAGNVDSQYWLGRAFDVGNDLPRDLDAAIIWYRRAAEAGHVEAQHNLGSALRAERREAEALAWYEKAAAQDHVSSIGSLAALFYAGQGVKQDRDKAFQLWSRAAELGSAEAMWSLANVYRVGALGEPDLLAACAWNLRARGYAKPIERGLLARTRQTEAFLETRLHAGEIAACRTLAAKWVPKPQPK